MIKELIAGLVVLFLMCAFVEWSIFVGQWSIWTRIGFCLFTMAMLTVAARPTRGGVPPKK